LSYDIKPFKDEVLCDVATLEVCDVLLGQPYLQKHHVVYESRPHSVIITLDNKLYSIQHSIDLTPDALLPKGPVYHHSLLENEEIKG
jgi:hypothetical protein